MNELIPILVSKEDAEEDTRCAACGYPLVFGDRAWQDEARSLLACRGDSDCRLSPYVQLLLDEAGELITSEGELT